MALELRAGADDGGRRLDRILRKALPELPLSGVYRLLRKGLVLVDGKPGRAEDRLSPGARIQIRSGGIYPVKEGRGGRSSPKGELFRRGCGGGTPIFPPLDGVPILWEGAGLIFLNKPPGMVVHGPESLETLVLRYLRGKLPPSLSFKPGPLHRLDRPTSGIIAFS
ncbi:MAG: RluA family pseudouridine synthase, partial [Treponema sp.]|nr:RluA family pseudouridine synthase [Treponema sp.]